MLSNAELEGEKAYRSRLALGMAKTAGKVEKAKNKGMALYLKEGRKPSWWDGHTGLSMSSSMAGMTMKEDQQE